MARTKGTVLESLRSLRELEERHRGTMLEPRVQMLRFLKEKPSRTFKDIGAMLGCSERNVQRWWETYQKDGIEKLMQLGRRGGRVRRIDEEKLLSLQQKLEIEGFSGLKEVQEWLRSQHDVTYSRSGLWHLLRTTAKAAPRGWMLVHEDDAAKTRRIRQSYSATTGIPSHIVRFLNALPTSANSMDWVSEFREALQGVFSDVDRVSVNVNLDCSLSDPESYTPGQRMTQHVTPEAEADKQVAISSEKAELKPSERIMEDFRRQGLPLHAFHPPHSFDYYYGGQAYLGTIFLWRAIDKPAISEFTIETLIALEPFLIFALSDLVARHQSEKPVDRIFHDALEHMFTEANLTAQEGRVVVLQLMGHSYKEMADMLSVTVDTVKKHFKQVHRKTNTRSQAELFAKYFSPRLMPEELNEWSQ